MLMNMKLVQVCGPFNDDSANRVISYNEMYL